MKTHFFLFSLLFLIAGSTVAQNYSLYGTVKDEVGETIIGASVYVSNTIGTVSNTYGFYSLSVPAGNYELVVSFMGRKTLREQISIGGKTEHNITLHEAATQLSEVVVSAHTSPKHTEAVDISRQTLNVSILKRLPAFAGEVDIIRGLQMLPGVQSSNEGTTNMSIRGGSYDQNLVLLDEAPVYNPAHALSFFSVFNPDAIKDVQLYKGIYPPRYGGRTSSVIDIKMKEGNNQKMAVSGGVGLIASRLTIEAPIVKDKASFMLSGRYSYAGQMLNLLGETGAQLGHHRLNNFHNYNEINFYDLNAKLNYTVDSKSHIYISLYSGRDHFFYYALNNNNSMDWGNTTATFRWNKIYGAKLFANLSLVYSAYDYAYIIKDDSRNFRWSSGMQYYNAKYDFDYYATSEHHIRYGTSVVYNTYSPGNIEPRDSSSVTKPFGLPHKQAVETAVYVSDKYTVNRRWSAEYGLRATLFFNIGKATVYQYSVDMDIIIDSTLYGAGQVVKRYPAIEPYVSARFTLGANASIKGGYSRKCQFQHLISNSSVGLPTDVWLPADSYLKPQQSDNYSIGFFGTTPNTQIEFSAETYYRKFYDIVDYKDNADLFLNPNLETQILSGIGQAYGLELMLAKNSGQLKGFVAYTLSKAEKKIPGVNNNQTFSPVYDKRHNLTANLSYDLSTRWLLSSVFRYVSGGFATIPLGSSSYHGASFIYYSKRNEYQIPAYHSLDIAAKYRRHYKKMEYDYTLSVNNVYNRHNVFSLFVKQDHYDLNITRGYKMYLFGIFPSLAFNFKF